ncbi:MAG: MarR family transcriptional regulator [Acidimicrobiia bacterium]
MSAESVSAADYQRLLELRTGLRRFLKWSADQARASGLTPAQHQLLLTIKGHRGPPQPTISELAEYLQLRHHSAVELIDRAEQVGLVQRMADPNDARVVRLQLTTDGERMLGELSTQHLHELERLAPNMSRLWVGLD